MDFRKVKIDFRTGLYSLGQNKSIAKTANSSTNSLSNQLLGFQ
jgi:hypothetical protein